MWDDDEFFKHQVSRATGTDIGGAWGAIGAQEHQNEKTRQEAFNQPRDLRTPKRSRPLETERPQLTKQQRAELRARAAAAEQRRKRFWHVIRSVIYFGVVSLCALIAIGIIGEQAPTTPDWITTLDCMAIGGAVAAMVLLYAAFNAKSYVQRFGV
ncbi:hypothetical protein KC906_00015, partial [Candidatus Kaiserbacteria bacterium]|nr:hypothetical protein [Candidatus Kaiserbacteria bacterium]